MYWYILKVTRWIARRQAETELIGLVKASPDRSLPWLRKGRLDIIAETLGPLK